MTDPPRPPPEWMQVVGIFAAAFVVVVLSAVAIANFVVLGNLHSLLDAHSSELNSINALVHQITNATSAGNTKYTAAIIQQRSIIAHQNAIIALLHQLLARMG